MATFNNPIDDTYREPQSEAFKSMLHSVRLVLADMLSNCTEAQQDMFARMYPEGIDAIPADRLDWACKQVENTLTKNGKPLNYPPPINTDII